jgi:hypothetical protein
VLAQLASVHRQTELWSFWDTASDEALGGVNAASRMLAVADGPCAPVAIDNGRRQRWHPWIDSEGAPQEACGRSQRTMSSTRARALGQATANGPATFFTRLW